MPWLKKHWFNVTLVALFALALAAPGLGADESPLHPRVLRTLAVLLIFFLTGVTLRLAELRRGLASARLHVFGLGFGFVWVPAVAVGLRWAFDGVVRAEILQGIVVLAVMPTTITSCVVFTTLAGGNVAGAVFSSIASNLAGVAVSPLLFGLLVAPDTGTAIDWSQLVTLLEIIVAPLAAGVAAQRWLGKAVDARRQYLPYLSGGALLLIVFFAFASAFAPGSPLRGWSAADLLGPLLLIAALHCFLLAAAWLGARWAGLGESDRRAALFVAPQKTVALGLPLLHVFFAAQPALAGIMSIPLIFYHPLQLLVAGALATRLARRG